MTQAQENYQDMSIITLGVMESNNDEWTTDVTTASRMNDVTTTLTNISVLDKKQGLNAKGATKTKNTLWAECATTAEHIDDGLIAYYESKNDETNLAIIKFTHSDFVHCSFAEGYKRMSLVQSKAAGIAIANLIPFKVVATDITEFAVSLGLLKTAAPANRLMKVTNKAITKAINEQFKILKPQMKKLDSSVNTYKKDSPTFVSEYKIGRKIIHYGKGHTTAELNLMPIETESVLGNKYTVGDVLTIRNHSDFTIHYGLTDTPDILPAVMQSLESNTDIKVTVEKDAKDSFGHWLIVHNPNEFDDVSVTVLVAKG